MVKVLTENKFVCEICHRVYKNVTEAKECEAGHDIIYVAFKRDDLKRLIAFLNLGEPKLLTPSLIETLDRYSTITAEPAPGAKGITVPTFD